MEGRWINKSGREARGKGREGVGGRREEEMDKREGVGGRREEEEMDK